MVKLSLLNFVAITASAAAQCVSIADLVCSVSTLSTLCECISESGLQPALSEGQWTLFAPTNHAFYQIEDQLSEIRENPDMLASLIMYHAVEEVVYTNSLSCSGTLEMASGQTCTTVCQNGIIYQTGEANSENAKSKIVAENVEACNGVVHIVDNVMLPENPEPESNNPPSCQTIVDIACSNDDFSTLCTAIKQAGLETTLSSGIWTVFAPTNEAFTNLGYTLDAVLADNMLLTNVLRCHVVNRPLFANDLQCGGTINMENGEPSTTVCEGEIIFQVGLGNNPNTMPQIVSTDIEACNGVVHVVNEVILPQMEDAQPEIGEGEEESAQETCQSIVDIACSTAQFSTLCAAVTQAGLENTLSSGSWTLFAPTNQAFANLGVTLDAVLADTELLTDILLYHTVDGVVNSSGLRCRGEVAMANGKTTTTLCAPNCLYQTGDGNRRDAMPKIMRVDIGACNGVIHVVNQVILPEIEESQPEIGEPEQPETPDTEEGQPEIEEPQQPETPGTEEGQPEIEEPQQPETPGTEEGQPEMGEGSGPGTCRSIVDIACNSAEFSTLCAAVTKAGLENTLSSGSWTLFAPTNDAFEKLGDTLDAVLADTELLTDILLYHVVDGVVSSSGLVCRGEVAMANGKTTSTLCAPDCVYQTGDGNSRDAMPKIKRVNIGACNGVIHVVNQVILPEIEDAQPEIEEPEQPEIEEPLQETEVEQPEIGDGSGPGTCPSIVDLACSSPEFSTLCAAVTQAGLGNTLSSGSWTIFAPTNEAFAKLGDTLDFVLSDNARLREILLLHVIDYRVYSTDLVCTKKIRMFNGMKTCTICVGESLFQVGRGNNREARPELVSVDTEVCNGVIHVVNEVILPKVI